MLIQYYIRISNDKTIDANERNFLASNLTCLAGRMRQDHSEQPMSEESPTIFLLLRCLRSTEVDPKVQPPW